MTGFSIGLVATLMWMAVLTGLALSVRSGPGSPDQSIREFQKARRKMPRAPEARQDSSYAPPVRSYRRRPLPEARAAGNRPGRRRRHEPAPPVVTRRAPAPRTKTAPAPRPSPAGDAEIDRLITSLLSAPDGMDSPEPPGAQSAAPPAGKNGASSTNGHRGRPRGGPAQGFGAMRPSSPPNEATRGSSPRPREVNGDRPASARGAKGPASSRRAANGTSPRPAPDAKKYARSDGRLTYFLVDDEGRPQPNDN